MSPETEKKGIPLEPGGPGFIPTDGFKNPSGDRMRGTNEEFEAFEAGVEPPHGVPGKDEDNPEGDRPPLLDQEKKAKPDEQPSPDEQAAPEDDKTETAKEETGQEPKSPVEGILAKYGSVEELAKGYKAIQQLESLKGKELKEAQEQLSRQLELIDEYFVTDHEGNRKLRVDRIVDQLKTESLPPSSANLSAIRGEVTKSRRKMFKDANMDDEDVDEAIKNTKDSIDQEVKLRASQQEDEVKRHHYEINARASTIAHKYFAEHPEHKEVLQAVDQNWYARFPTQLRSQAINEGWLPIPQVAQAEYLKANVDKMLKEAYEAGLEQRDIKPTEGGTPSSSGPAPDLRGDVNIDDQIKANILNAGKLKSLDEIFPDD